MIIGITGTDGVGEKVWDSFASPALDLDKSRAGVLDVSKVPAPVRSQTFAYNPMCV